MKKKILSIVGPSIFTAILVLYVLLNGCSKLNEPTSDNLSTKNICLNVFDSKDNSPVNGFDVILELPDGTKSYHSEMNNILIDISNVSSGQCRYAVKRDGYALEYHQLLFDDTEAGNNLIFANNIFITKKSTPTLIRSSIASYVIIDDSTTIEFPVGCLNEDTRISITEIPTSLSRGAIELYNEELSLKTFHFEPEGLVFNKPILIKFPLPQTAEAIQANSSFNLGYFNENTKSWELTPVLVDENKIFGTAEIKHFSSYSVLNAKTRISYKFQEYTAWKKIAEGDCESDVSGTYTYSNIDSCEEPHNITSYGTAKGKNGKITTLWARIKLCTYTAIQQSQVLSTCHSIPYSVEFKAVYSDCHFAGSGQ